MLPAREGWHCAAGGGCLRTCAVPPFARPSDSPLPLRAGLPNPNLFCFRPWTFVAAATASFPDAGRCQNSSSPMSLPSIHHGYTFTFPSAAYLSPHPLDFSAAQRSRRPPPPAAAIHRGYPWPQRQRRWAERSNTPTGGPFPMSGFFFKASPQEPQTLTSPYRVPLGSSYVFSASQPPQLAGARSGSG